MFIKEIVKLDTQGKFIPAVQLSDFDSQQDNLGLVKSYIFANSAPDSQGKQTRAVGSIDLLRELRLAYINGSSNRFVVVANYGHGKSHLALVLANYFGKPYESEEVKEVLKRIETPLQNNLPEAENFNEFKRQYDRFLVVRLRGDVPRTLREQFFPSLKNALLEHPTTENVELPFWHTEAIKWLDSKTDDKQAQMFLNDLGTDFPNLIQEVNENKHEAYEQYVQLFAHLNNGVKPNAESNYSLREAVIWIADHLCGEGKPLAGMLVLFDEFSQFVERYSQSNAIGDLQDLLQGIGDRKGKTLFLALSPLDPDEVADRVQNGQVLQNIKRELGRIDRKYSLYSLMESVLSASINPSNAAWGEFLAQNPECKGPMYGQATEAVWTLYQKRYDKELGWTNDKFRDVVTKGCFPLHPFTTALLCHLKMQQGLDDDARTILKFVREQVEFKLNEPAIKDGKINWILPINLADYFGKRIASDQIYAAYEKAIDNLEQTFGDKVTQAQYDVLKALLLQIADGLNITGGKQVELISHMTGLDFDTTKKKLRELSEHSVTKFDSTTNYNSFWPVAVNPQALEQKIREYLTDRKFGDDELFALNNQISSLYPGTDRIEVSVSWGTSSDWAANSLIVTKETFSPENLKKLMKTYQTSFQGLQEGNRGLVVWLLAMTESDIDFFKEKASEFLKDAFSTETPPPVLLIVPTLPTKSVADQFMRYQALISIGKDPDVIKEVGQVVFDSEKDRTKKALWKALGQLFGDEEQYANISRKPATLVVPQPYKANLLALINVNIQDVLHKLYELAYPYRPPEFFTDLPGNPKKGASPLRDATKTVAKNLLHNRIGSALAGMTKVAQERVCKQNLMLKWHILSTTYWIQEPEVLSLKHAWDYLEEQVKPGDQETPVTKIIPNLLNSPFGFDFNTATLLFTAWIGKHNNELRFYSKGRSVGVDFIEKLLDENSPQDFLGKICVQECLSIARRDADKSLIEGRSLVARIQKGEQHNQSEAEEIINILTEIVNSGICPEDEKTVFSQAIVDLQTSFDLSNQYDQKAKKLLPAISGDADIRRLLDLRNSIKQMPVPGIVLPAQPPTTEIQETVDNRIKKVIEASCKQAETLNRIEGADAVRNTLHDQKELLRREGLLASIELIAEAEKKLEERIKKLKADAEEASLKNQINAMTAKADLVKLYEYREALKGMHPVTAELISTRDQKLQSIQLSISEMETFANTVSQTYKTIEADQAEVLYERILRNINRYTGSTFEEVLNQALEYLRNVKSFVSEIKEIEKLPLRKPEDIPQIQEYISQVAVKYEASLDSAYKSIMERAQNDFDYRVQSEYDKTEAQVAEIERMFDSYSSDQIRKRFSQIPLFVTDEMKVRIKHIRSLLEQKETEERLASIEKNTQDVIERIENLFLSIQDTSRRQECLERLQKRISILK